MYARDRRDRHSISHSAPPALTGSRRYARQIVEVKRDGPYGEAVASIDALGTVVGGICRYRGPLRTLPGGPRKVSSSGTWATREFQLLGDVIG
jgi:hypothetical protein